LFNEDLEKDLTELNNESDNIGHELEDIDLDYITYKEGKKPDEP
jgi:hypothetical protein